MPFPRAGRAVQRLSAPAIGALLLASAMEHFRDPGFYRQVVPDYLCREDGSTGGAGVRAATSDDGTGHGAVPSRPFALLSREEWITVSGLLELFAAVGILVPGTRAQRTVHSMRLPLLAPLIAWAWSLRKPAAGAGL